MKFDVLLRPAAERDLRAARDWYRRQSAATARRFALAIGAALNAIAKNPAMFPHVHGAIHRAMTRRFPYAIYFVVDQRRVSILRVLHQARNPESVPKD